MKKVRLTEKDLLKIVKKVIVSEQKNIIVKDGLTIDDIIENGDNSEIIYIGSKGDGVKEIQEILKDLEYDLGDYGINHDGIDSKFGYRTRSAVEEFQEDEDIKDDGIVGIETAKSFREVGEEIDDEEIDDDLIDGDIKFPSDSSSASKPMKHRGRKGKPHHGYDISADGKIFRKNGNVPLVVCNKSGVVTYSKWVKGYGNFVEIKHGENDYSAYGHLDSSSVTKGEPINVGDVIGVEGTTGHSDGDHVHFEFRVKRPKTGHGSKTRRGGDGAPDVEVNDFNVIRPISDVDEYYYYQVGDSRNV